MPLLPTKPVPTVVQEEPTRKERLAVNLFDLDRIDPLIRGVLLKDRLVREPIKVDPNVIDEVAVEFKGSLLSAACVCDTIRARDKEAGDHPTRVYIYRSKAWTKLSGSVVLSEVVLINEHSMECRLSPTVFPPPIADIPRIPLVDPVPLPSAKITIGES